MGITIYKFGCRFLDYMKINLDDQNGTINYLIKSKKKKLKPLEIPIFTLDFLLENDSIINLEKQYYKDINNEQNLILLLEEYEKIIVNKNIEDQGDKIIKFQFFLFKYMDVLSNKNRQKFTKIEHQSNIEKFENFINLLDNEYFDSIKNNKYFLGYHDLAERDKFIYSDNFKIKKIQESFIELDKNIE